VAVYRGQPVRGSRISLRGVTKAQMLRAAEGSDLDLPVARCSDRARLEESLIYLGLCGETDRATGQATLRAHNPIVDEAALAIGIFHATDREHGCGTGGDGAIGPAELVPTARRTRPDEARERGMRTPPWVGWAHHCIASARHRGSPGLRVDKPCARAYDSGTFPRYLHPAVRPRRAPCVSQTG